MLYLRAAILRTALSSIDCENVFNFVPSKVHCQNRICKDWQIGMQLRPYQIDLQEAIRAQFRSGKRRVVAQSPTGSGKGVVFSSITQGSVAKGNRITIVAHRSEILDQISKTLLEFGVKHGRLQSGHRSSLIEPVQVASIGTLVNRLDIVPEPDMWIGDEIHHAVSSQWVKLFASWPNSKVCGFSATPERLDGRGLGEFFESMVHGPPVQWLMDKGFLARAEYYGVPPCQAPDLSEIAKVAGDFNKGQIAEAVDKPKITGNAVDHYRRICPNARAIAFCVTIKHAEHVREQFNAAGIASEVIDGKLSDDDRRQRVENLRSGATRVMVSCELVSEGFDVPACDAAILLRPTWSLGLFLQQIGRALRPKPNGGPAYVLDHVGNCTRHGFAETPRAWNLEGKKARQKTEALVEAKQCSVCFAMFAGSECPQCGSSPIPKPRSLDEQEGTLVKLTPEQKAQETRNRKAEERQAVTIEELTELGRSRGYAHPAAWAKIKFHSSWRRFVAKPNEAVA